MKANVKDADMHNLGWEFHADDGRWYWIGTDSGIQAQVSSNTSRISALEAGGGGGGDSFWTSTGPNEITYNGTIVVEDAVATG